jgi:RIO kinase 1
MRTMFHKCRLVHADLSEYNILYFKGHLWIIDVSQSVEHDHPNALLFLRKDCENIKDFFTKNKILTMNTRELFDFITDPTITDENVESYLDIIQQKITERGSMTPEEEIDDAVFKQVHIPRTLTDVAHFERDAKKAVAGENENLFYLTLTGMKDDVSGAREVPLLLQTSEINESQVLTSDNTKREVKEVGDVRAPSVSSVSEKGEKENEEEPKGRDEEEEDEDEDEDEDEENKEGELEPQELTKKERKKMIKEENREKRKNKTPKHVKKRKKLLAKRKK